MAKRRTSGRNPGRYNSEDNPIDIDGAFTPVKGKQSVDYDVDDERIGLTQAFGPVLAEEEPRYGADDNEKWANFDWNASYGDTGELAVEHIQPEDVAAAAEGAKPASAAVASATAGAATGAAASTDSGKASGRGRHAAPSIEDSPRMRQSRRMRRSLIVLIVLLLLGLAALGFFMFRTYTESQEQAVQQTQEQATSDKNSLGAADETATSTAKRTEVPDLSQILGLTQDEAIDILKHGATVSSTREATDEDGAVKTNVTVVLTSEPSDSRTNSAPSVYLGLDESGAIVQAGYSASASALGFGSLSFADAVTNERVIEKTLQSIGVDVGNEVVELPADKDEYSTYAADGTTVVKERCSFEGEADVNGSPCTWSAVLSYDYGTQILTGNLSDTVRVIYVYVTKQ